MICVYEDVADSLLRERCLINLSSAWANHIKPVGTKIAPDDTELCGRLRAHEHARRFISQCEEPLNNVAVCIPGAPPRSRVSPPISVYRDTVIIRGHEQRTPGSVERQEGAVSLLHASELEHRDLGRGDRRKLKLNAGGSDEKEHKDQCQKVK